MMAFGNLRPETGEGRHPVNSSPQNFTTTTMKTNQVIESWKSADVKQVIGASVINKEMMAEIQGGAGYIKTLSGECNTTRTSCVRALKDVVNRLFDMIL